MTHNATALSPSGDGKSLSSPVKLTVIAALVVNLYALCFSTVSDDMSRFLVPWFDHIVRHGPIGAFAHPFSDYTPPYLYLLAGVSLGHGLLSAASLIKLLSLAGTGFLALAFSDLLKAVGAQARQALALLVLPTVLINAALLGQCDALWSGACIFAIAAMIRGRTASSLLWCGVAVAFKAQSVFIAPLIIGALIQRRAPIWQWTIPALVYAAMMVPAWLAGWPASDLFSVYLRQAGEYDFAGRLATPWVWVGMTIHDAAANFYFLGYSAAAAAAGGIAFLSYRARQATMLPIALLSAIALPFLLPRMHERYFFLADVLALALALSLRTRMAIIAAVSIQLASLASLFCYFTLFFYQHPFPALIGSQFAAAALIATWHVVRDDDDRSMSKSSVPALA